MKYHDVDFDTYFRNYPDANGYFGKYGGSYIPPQLQAAMDEITDAYMTICKSSKFVNELRRIRREFQGRPTPVSHLERLSSSLGNVQLYAKREDLNHTGAKRSWPSTWARKRLSPKPARDNTAWRWQRQRHTSDWNATSTWAPWM